MEAATPLPLQLGRVEVRAGAVLIADLIVADERFVDLVRQRIEQGDAPEDVTRQALEIGARVLDRESSSVEVDFIRRELEKVSSEVERSFGERAHGVATELGAQMEAAFGEDGGAVAKALSGHSEQLAEQIASTFGSERSSAIQHQIKELVERSLRESQQNLVRLFSSAEGQNPLADFKASVVRELKAGREGDSALLEKVGALQLEVQRLRDAGEAEAEIDAERERGAGKGRTFEAIVFEAIERLADSRGDSAVHTGDSQAESGDKVGDVVVELDGAIGDGRGRVVFEAKDKRLSRPDAWRELDAAMAVRDAQFAILVVSSEAKIPARTEPLAEFQGNKMIVTFDKDDLDERGLDIAYRYARCKLLAQRDATSEVDAAGVRAATEEAAAALRDTQKIRGHLTKATNGVSEAREVLEIMETRIRAALERVENLIAAGDPG